jgi:hypothetical protein
LKDLRQLHAQRFLSLRANQAFVAAIMLALSVINLGDRSPVPKIRLCPKTFVTTLIAPVLGESWTLPMADY